MEDNRQEFLNIYDACIRRDGAALLREYLLKSDFFSAPASTRYHCACGGGLCEHSVNTYRRLLALVQGEYGEQWEEKVSRETVAICGLLHDVCKIDFYKQDFRNVKENGVWVQRPYYAREEVLPFGHGEKSVYIINGFIRLTREEAMAINWHMGGFDEAVRGGSFALAHAFEKYPLAVKLHLSDLEATYLRENRDTEEKA